jgi:hypothetical protein
MNARNDERTVVDVCVCVGLSVSLSLLGNNSVKMFPRQRRIIEDVVFYAVYVVSKESRLLMLHRTYC